MYKCFYKRINAHFRFVVDVCVAQYLTVLCISYLMLCFNIHRLWFCTVLHKSLFILRWKGYGIEDYRVYCDTNSHLIERERERERERDLLRLYEIVISKINAVDKSKSTYSATQSWNSNGNYPCFNHSPFLLVWLSFVIYDWSSVYFITVNHTYLTKFLSNLRNVSMARFLSIVCNDNVPLQPFLINPSFPYLLCCWL